MAGRARTYMVRYSAFRRMTSDQSVPGLRWRVHLRRHRQDCLSRSPRREYSALITGSFEVPKVLGRLLNASRRRHERLGAGNIVQPHPRRTCWARAATSHSPEPLILHESDILRAPSNQLTGVVTRRNAAVRTGRRLREPVRRGVF